MPVVGVSGASPARSNAGVRSRDVSVQLLKLPPAVDRCRRAVEGDTWPGAIFLIIERDKGNSNYKDHGIGGTTEF